MGVLRAVCHDPMPNGERRPLAVLVLRTSIHVHHPAIRQDLLRINPSTVHDPLMSQVRGQVEVT
jgi:hypothetical protein